LSVKVSLQVHPHPGLGEHSIRKHGRQHQLVYYAAIRKQAWSTTSVGVLCDHQKAWLKTSVGVLCDH